MQTDPTPADARVADASETNWVDRFAPDAAKPYLRLMRLDRPIGFLLLFWPCVFSLGLAYAGQQSARFAWLSAVLFLLGAILMRGAGCVFNDIVDRDIDAKVARTRQRPIASGRVSVRTAAIFLVLLSLAGLLILLQFNLFTVWLGVASLGLVAIYPFMKRITYWPQLFLGLAFSYGALMGWASETGSLSVAPVVLYLGTILWVIGYDTIYALQDVEDDALIGVRSTARLFGDKARVYVGLFYAGAYALWVIAGVLAGAGWPLVVLSIPTAAILAWQVITLAPSANGNSLKRFKANHYAGLALSAAFILSGLF